MIIWKTFEERERKKEKEIKRILNQEMSDTLCMCFTGRISRLLNCLNVMDPLVYIHIVNLSDMFIEVGQRLIKKIIMII